MRSRTLGAETITSPRFPTYEKLREAAGASTLAACGPVLNQASMLIDAVIDGQGIALARTTLLAWDLLNGRLVIPVYLVELTKGLPIVSPHGGNARAQGCDFPRLDARRSDRRYTPLENTENRNARQAKSAATSTPIFISRRFCPHAPSWPERVPSSASTFVSSLTGVAWGSSHQ